MSNEGRIRVGVIGVGQIGKRHVETYAKMSNVEVLGLPRRRQAMLLLVCALLLLTALLPGAAALAQSAQRIEFVPGATAATVRGVATATAPASYLLRAEAGQTMRVTANYVNNTY